MLNGKTTIITGASRNIGRELALEFARSGANTVCCGRSIKKLEGTVRLIDKEGGKGVAIPTDVTDWSSVQNMVEKTIEHFGRIDLLFNNAGRFKSVGPIWEADPKEWWEDVTVNLRGTMLCCRAVLPHMIEHNSGVIINMDGGGGSVGPNAGGSGYGCSKAAVVRFSEGLAQELEREGFEILVFCMNPGFVHTDMTEYLISDEQKMKWQSHVKQLMGSVKEMPPYACARATVKLLNISSRELSGRVFYADTNFEKVGKRRQDIKQQNLFVLHYNTGDVEPPRNMD